ncbi:hypothetical protein HUE87_05450 [Candidatus Sulfurimonas marisnigri]|uniref:Uncharacterized protein n=1 Tax=Candidatus Sulfurimonas marisnigri TaxID=2740405 RepID=A0A7S7M213_9BACT|nr:hypothetical protein [Candidatus Sulfurimonas marisnigri]QOY55671.1 hypothetical protein HUE87_05450 [Candidatus Sulfurimonas marisnigri]
MKKQTYLQILFFITAVGIVFFYNSKYQITLNENAFPISIERQIDETTMQAKQIVTKEVSVKVENDSNLSISEEKNTTVVKKEIVRSEKTLDKKIEKPVQKPIQKHKPKLVNKNRKFLDASIVKEIPMDVYSKYDARNTKKSKIYKKEIIVIDNTDFDIVASPMPDEVLRSPKKSYKQKQYKREKVPKKLEDIKRVAVLSDYKRVKIKKIDKSVENVKANRKVVSTPPGGENIYSNRCRLCHGKSESFIVKYTAQRWRELLADDGKIINSVHEKTRVSKLTQRFYKSKNYSTQFASLKDFIFTSVK